MKSGTSSGAGHPNQLKTCTNTIMTASGLVHAGGDNQLTFCPVLSTENCGHVTENNSCLDTQTITLQPPSSCAATATSSSSINLSWQDNSTNESGFIVERRRLGSGRWAQIGTTAADTVTFSSGDELFSESTYIYRVQAFNDSESSAYSNEAEATTTRGSAIVADRRIHTLLGGVTT